MYMPVKRTFLSKTGSGDTVTVLVEPLLALSALSHSSLNILLYSTTAEDPDFLLVR